jgi:hypothetical protein
MVGVMLLAFTPAILVVVFAAVKVLYFNLKDVKIKWLGITHWWKNGFVSWFEIEFFGGKHYFISETGTFIFGSSVCAIRSMRSR